MYRPYTPHGHSDGLVCQRCAAPFAEKFVIESAAIENQNIPPWKVRETGHMQAYQSMLALADARRAFESLPDTGKDIWTDALGQRDLKNWQTLIGREQHLWGDRALDQDTLGQYRQWNIALGMPDGSMKSIGAQWSNVDEEMDDLWDIVVQPGSGYGTGYVHGKRWETWSPLEQAAIIHHFFERIHPFGDGNGRSGRLLALYVLRRANVGPVLFMNYDKAAEYYPCFTEKSPERMIDYFRSHQVESWD